jgi:hypothetical protein
MMLVMATDVIVIVESRQWVIAGPDTHPDYHCVLRVL